MDIKGVETLARKLNAYLHNYVYHHIKLASILVFQFI